MSAGSDHVLEDFEFWFLSFVDFGLLVETARFELVAILCVFLVK